MSIIATARVPGALPLRDELTEPVARPVPCPPWCTAEHWRTDERLHHGEAVTYYGDGGGIIKPGAQTITVNVEHYDSADAPAERPVVAVLVGESEAGLMWLDSITARRLSLSLAALADQLDDGGRA